MYPSPSDEQILAILERHRLPGGVVEASPHEGSVNYVRMAGEFCVRILKEEDYASDLYTEAVSVPALRACGVTTPELVAFDETREIVPGIATIYRRMPGIPLGESKGVADEERLIREIGRQIELWRSNLTTLDDPEHRLDRPRHDRVQENYERNADRLSDEERHWVEAMIRRLEGAEEGAPVFVNWDLHPFNILVHRGEFSAIVDWGDAGWGEASLNYQRLPAAWLPRLLTPGDDLDPNLIGRTIYGLLAYALNDVHRPNRGDSPYAHRGHSRWESLHELLRSDLPDAWRSWLVEP